MTTFRICLLTLSVFLPAVCLGEFTINPIFSDGAVIQRNAAIPIWGTADPGEKIAVSFRSENVVVIADDNGSWKASLKAMKASTKSAKLRVECEGQTIVIDDVLVGDVWLCSGQSNMGFKLANCVDGKADSAGAADTLIRVNKIREPWLPCVGKVAAETSGVAYYFARKRREMTPNVPVGLVLRALSGSPIEAWTPVDALMDIDFSRDMMKRFTANSDEGKRWLAYAEAESEWKRRKRNGDRKSAGKKPTFEGDDDTKVLAELYCADNPGRLWRERIEPLAGYAIAGVIWYQGEKNSKSVETASIYSNVLIALIESWRDAWGQGDFRFLAVQLPPFAKGGPNWETVQQGQAAAVKKVSNSESIDLSDLPDEAQLHPPNKRPVGERLADIAMP